jgi:hypothetical protein
MGGPSKPEFARGAQRQAEHPVEVRLVSMPPDADTDVVLGAKDLTYSGAWAAESFDHLDDRAQPLRDRIGVLKPAHGIVVSKSERGHAAFAFVLTELDRLQWQSRYVSDQSRLRCRRHELLGISQTFRPRQFVGKPAESLGQADLPSRANGQQTYAKYIGTVIRCQGQGRHARRRQALGLIDLIKMLSSEVREGREEGITRISIPS